MSISTHPYAWISAFALFILTFFGTVPSAPAQEFSVVPSERVVQFVNVRDAPSGDRIARLSRGERLPFVRSVPRWHEVRLSDGQSGFVSKSWTRVVPILPDDDRGELRIHFLSIGAGTCTVVECPGPNAPPMIIDCGSTGGGGEMALDRDEARQRVQEILNAHDTAPNVVLSHADTDHYTWVPTILDGISVQHIWQGGDPDDYRAGAFPNWLHDQQSRGAIVHQGLEPRFHNGGEPVGDELSCGTASAFILTVNSDPQANKNTQSLMLMIEHGDFTAIFTGDATGIAEDVTRANFSGAVKASVLSSSHHGSSSHRSNSTEWVEATAPPVVIYSSGRRHGHPRCLSTNRFEPSLATAPPHQTHCNNTSDFAQRQIKNTALAQYVTDVVGSVVITSTGQSPMRLECDLGAQCTAEIAH